MARNGKRWQEMAIDLATPIRAVSKARFRGSGLRRPCMLRICPQNAADMWKRESQAWSCGSRKVLSLRKEFCFLLLERFSWRICIWADFQSLPFPSKGLHRSQDDHRPDPKITKLSQWSDVIFFGNQNIANCKTLLTTIPTEHVLYSIEVPRIYQLWLTMAYLCRANRWIDLESDKPK